MNYAPRERTRRHSSTRRVFVALMGLLVPAWAAAQVEVQPMRPAGAAPQPARTANPGVGSMQPVRPAQPAPAPAQPAPPPQSPVPAQPVPSARPANLEQMTPAANPPVSAEPVAAPSPPAATPAEPTESNDAPPAESNAGRVPRYLSSDAAAALRGRTVTQVEFIGLERVGEDTVRRIIQTREGQPFDPAMVQDDTNELLRSRKFLVVRAEPVVDAQGVVVTFEVREKPIIESVTIEGNVELKTADLEKVLGFSTGQPLDEYLVNRGREEILRKYREEGYAAAEVTLDRDLMSRENRVRYTISEGPRIRVREIRIEGNASYARSELLPKVTTQTYLWPFRSGAFDEETADRDALELQRYYRGEGYLDAKVGYRLDYEGADRRDLTVTFVVEEGARYTLARIEIEGNEVLTAEQLRAVIQLRENEFMLERVLEDDKERLVTLYGEIGYIDTLIQGDYRFTEQPGVVVVRFQIEESPQYRFGRITIRGNQRTQDRVVRRELRFSPGEPYNTTLTKRAERRLRETGLFSKATITPLPPEELSREALVEVEEGQNINILFGVGVSTDNGLLGNIELENRNFDLFDWPRTFEELFTGQAFRGAGQRMRVRLEPGTELSRFRIDFTEPYLMDKNLRLDWSGYLFERRREGYDESRAGMLIGLSRRFEGGLLDSWTIEGTLRIENVGINDVEFLAPSDVRNVRGDSFLTSAKVGIVRDTTDSRLLPTEGYRLSLSYEQVGALGGDFSYGRPSASATWYKTLATDALDRKSVLALRADTSYIVGDAPVFDRFFGGGFGSLRGFAFRGVSPRKGVLDTPVGGEWIFLTSAEYSFPLYAQNVRGVTFIDMGTVEEDFEISDWRVSVGFGLRVNLDLFGPVPLVFDFGFPIAKGDEDDTQVFNFTFGASF